MGMRKYILKIVHHVEVEAASPSEAIKMYENKEIIVDKDDLHLIGALEAKDEE